MHALAFILALTLSAGDGLCPPQLQLAQAEACPALGPGAYALDLAAARLPAAPAELPLLPLERPDPILDWRYARLATPDAPLFATPEDAQAGNVKRPIGRGFIFVNLLEAVQAGDQALYKIRSGEYIRAADVNAVDPTGFQGLSLASQPAEAIGWIVASTRPSRLPGAAPPATRARLPRGRVIQIYAVQHVGEWDWFLVGLNEWVDQRAVARLNFNPPPAGVSGRWVQVDLFEQTLVAYEDDRPVYATLVSSGLTKWATQPGLFKVWARLKVDNMSGSYEADGSDYYSLEAVPYVLYFDGSRALHGEYWHDKLGFKRSHGCVNLSALDAHWIYNWASIGTPVWVYDPSGQTQADGSLGGAP